MKREEIFRFGKFRANGLTRTLQREDEVFSLNRRAFDVLLYLVQNPGRVLSREELLKNVWPDTSVDENSLEQSISTLRRALAEKPGDNNYVATLPGRGYQFMVPVEVEVRESLTVASPTPPRANVPPGGFLVQKKHSIQTNIVTEETTARSPGQPSRFRPVLVAASIFIMVAVGVIAVRKGSQRSQPAANQAPVTTVSSTSRRSIAVLGFRNLSGRSDEAWLSTAIAEMLSTELVAGEKLRLVPGEDIARAKLDFPATETDTLSRDTLSRLRKNLDSDFIVLGSYTVLGDKPDTHVRLDLRLQDTAGGETIADVAVSGSEAQMSEMVAQAGAKLRQKLGIEAVSPVEGVTIRASLPSNREAARLYAEGLIRLRVFDALGAHDLLRQAVAADPKFALAHSALAEAWWLMGYSKNAQLEAQQAFELSANLSREEKLLIEGRYREMSHDYDKAVEIYRALFTLFPDNLDYGLKLEAMQTRGGKPRDALATVDSLRKLAPPASDDPRIDLAESDVWYMLSDHNRQLQPLENAVQKARNLGYRLVLADALQKRCSLFGLYLGQIQKAAESCRESTEIHSATGDREEEAADLGTLAIITMDTDGPESIRLYQQALPIFREVGNPNGAATVLSNLGLVYAAQGQPATAEKMEREALVVYRRLNDRKGESKALGNLADYRVDQGDLAGGLRFYKESAKTDPSDPERAVLANANIAYVRQLQGDLAEAESGYQRSISSFQETGNQATAAILTSMLASVKYQMDDFQGARKLFEEALSVQTAANKKRSVADIEVSLAELSLEEGRSSAEQEAVIRKAIAVFQQQKANDSEAQAWCLLARDFTAHGNVAAAQDAMQHARVLASKSQNLEVRWRTSIIAARVATADKDAVHSAPGIAARKALVEVIAKSHQQGYGIVELDARLALAEIEMKAGQTAEARIHLAAIQAEAKTKGYNLVARKAASARA
jgi:eukaryotic-like serine/threonine-protein kinase